MTQQGKDAQEIKVSIPENLKGGTYCNFLRITHTKEEFIMDFMMITPPIGSVVSRVIMSPGHMKRTLSALKLNLEKYEKNYGSLKEAPEPAEERRLGFKTT
jgi:hypothetical protein